MSDVSSLYLLPKIPRAKSSTMGISVSILCLSLSISSNQRKYIFGLPICFWLCSYTYCPIARRTLKYEFISFSFGAEDFLLSSPVLSRVAICYGIGGGRGILRSLRNSHMERLSFISWAVGVWACRSDTTGAISSLSTG